MDNAKYAHNADCAALLALDCCIFGIVWVHNWHYVSLQYGWSLMRRLVWFGHSGDAWSGLVTWVTLGLVWSLRRRLSDLTHSGGVRGCVMIIFKTLSGFGYSGDVV